EGASQRGADRAPSRAIQHCPTAYCSRSRHPAVGIRAGSPMRGPGRRPGARQATGSGANPAIPTAIPRDTRQARTEPTTMANFTAADVKKLRDATGAGMMDTKRALEEADGDFAKATEILRIKGVAKAIKRGAERTASNGLVAAAEGAMIQLSCETDFVAKSEQFQQLAADIVAHVAATRIAELPALLADMLADGHTVAENIDSAAAVIGEKIELSRVAVFDGQVAS